MSREHLVRLGLGALASLCLTGCPSFATLKTARALDPGQLQVTAASEVLGMAAPSGKGVGGVKPDMIAAMRYGVADGFDVGVRLEPVEGVSADTTIQIVRSRAIDVALGPGGGYFQAPGPIGYEPKAIEELATSPLYTIWSASVPLLVGFNFPGGHQLVVAPRATAYFAQPGNPGGNPTPGGVEIFAGGSLGLSIKTSHALRVMPEIDVTKPVAWTGRGENECLAAACAPFLQSAVIVQGGLAFVLGADNLE
jgi:hypothetical protein